MGSSSEWQVRSEVSQANGLSSHPIQMPRIEVRRREKGNKEGANLEPPVTSTLRPFSE